MSKLPSSVLALNASLIPVGPSFYIFRLVLVIDDSFGWRQSLCARLCATVSVEPLCVEACLHPHRWFKESLV